MSTQLFVLAKRDQELDLVYGEFQKSRVGDLFGRHPVHGHAPWTIVKIFPREQQEELQAIERLVGFERLSHLFKT